MVHDRNGLEVLSRADCLALLASVQVGRVGVSIDALPTILPVNFGLDGDDIVFRTVRGTKLVEATRNAVIAFEADEVDAGTATGWSVVVTGRSHEVTEAEEIARLDHLHLASWALDGRADHWVRIRADLVSGRRIANAAEAS